MSTNNNGSMSLLEMGEDPFSEAQSCGRCMPFLVRLTCLTQKCNDINQQERLTPESVNSRKRYPASILRIVKSRICLALSSSAIFVAIILAISYGGSIVSIFHPSQRESPATTITSTSETPTTSPPWISTPESTPNSQSTTKEVDPPNQPNCSLSLAMLKELGFPFEEIHEHGPSCTELIKETNPDFAIISLNCFCGFNVTDIFSFNNYTAVRDGLNNSEVVTIGEQALRSCRGNLSSLNDLYLPKIEYLHIDLRSLKDCLSVLQTILTWNMPSLKVLSFKDLVLSATPATDIAFRQILQKNGNIQVLLLKDVVIYVKAKPFESVNLPQLHTLEVSVLNSNWAVPHISSPIHSLILTAPNLRDLVAFVYLTTEDVCRWSPFILHLRKLVVKIHANTSVSEAINKSTYAPLDLSCLKQFREMESGFINAKANPGVNIIEIKGFEEINSNPDLKLEMMIDSKSNSTIFHVDPWYRSKYNQQLCFPYGNATVWWKKNCYN